MRETTIRTLYVTKYVLTRGILKVTAEHDEGSPYAYWPPGRGVHNQVKIGKDAFDTLGEARADALKRFENRRLCLEKALAALPTKSQSVMGDPPEDLTQSEVEE